VTTWNDRPAERAAFPWRYLVWGIVALLAIALVAFGAASMDVRAGREVRLFLLTFLNGLTLAGLYFVVASGFTLIFGLMRNVNLAHGAIALLGAYIGLDAAQWLGSWYFGVAAGFLATAVFGLGLQTLVMRRMEGDEMRQTLVTIGISIVMADLMLAVWSGTTYQFYIPDALFGATPMPWVKAYNSYRLVVLGIAVVIGIALWIFLNRTALGMMIRAGVDDRGMLQASGVNVQLVFALTFAIGAGLAGLGGVIGGSFLSVSPGEDVRYLLASLVVVIVGGMGSIPGAAIGALLIGMAEQFGLAYSRTYGVVYTYIIMVAVLALRPEGIMGRRR